MKELSGTRELIFDNFVEMVSTLSYESVSMRDIAKKVGIQVASIYNHFDNKAQILEYAYDYYEIYQYKNRRHVDTMKKLIETASAQELINAFTYTFESEDPKQYIRMVLITKIIYMRLFQDPIANAIFARAFENNSNYVSEVLKHGVSIGRIDPDFDIGSFVFLLIGSMQIMGVHSFSSAGYQVQQLEIEKRISAQLARLLGTAMK